MATASQVHLRQDFKPAYHRPLATKDSTELATRLLQENHDQHHIFFNRDGFHNHIAHHLLSVWALGAGPSDIQSAYDHNKSYQRDMMALDASVVRELQHPEKLMSHMGREEFYPAFLAFFTQEIQKTGWQAVVQRYVFSRSPVAETMLSRMFGGFLHPIIHLGFGLEFEQPPIIAEALAQAAVHGDYLKKLFLPAEQKAQARKDGGEEPKTIVELLDAVYADPQMQEAPAWSDGNKLRDGVLGRAAERAVDLTSEFFIASPAELEKRTAEMIDAVGYFTAGAQRSNKTIKYDFYYMHCLNSSIFWSCFARQTWLDDKDKLRLLEWKVRADLAMYASRKCPQIRLDEIRNYAPKRPADGWDEIQDRVIAVPDDGHAAKLVRALAHGRDACAPFEAGSEFRVKRDDWLLMAHMAIDSVEDIGETPRWVRSAGFDEAWEEIPARAKW